MILVLTGPTGSGKSALAIELAKRLDAIIVNADAFQVYQELSIATAKPTDDMMMQVPHYLFDFVPLTSSYNVYEYQKDLRALLAEKSDKQDIIIAGGTGLYIRAALFDYEFGDHADADVSAYEKLSDEELHDVLRKMDPEEAEKIHPHNRKRVLRAISLILSTGRKKSEMIASQTHRPIYDVRFFGLEAERSSLYEKTDERVEQMFQQGLLEEVKTLTERYGRDRQAFQAIGVKELYPYFDGEITLEKAKEEIKKHTRNYVKRQMTFYRHQFEIEWISSVDEVLAKIGKK